MKEIWRDIPEYEGLYQASNLGNIRSLDRIIIGKNNKRIYKKGKTVYVDKKRYALICLWKNNHCKRHTIHRLVAQTFLDWHEFKYTEYDLGKTFSQNDLVVNHKDENKLNNNVNNLEWCTTSYNNRYGDNTNGLFLKVYQYDYDYNLITIYKSIKECARANNIPDRSLNRHCHKEDKYKGYIWSLEKR